MSRKNIITRVRADGRSRAGGRERSRRRACEPRKQI